MQMSPVRLKAAGPRGSAGLWVGRVPAGCCETWPLRGSLCTKVRWRRRLRCEQQHLDLWYYCEELEQGSL